MIQKKQIFIEKSNVQSKNKSVNRIINSQLQKCSIQNQPFEMKDNSRNNF